MFLSKRSNGVYYLWYNDLQGKRIKVSTGTKLKSDALKFYSDFKRTEHETERTSRTKTLSEFNKDFLAFASVNYSKGTLGIYKSTLTRFCFQIGDRSLSDVTPQNADEYKTARLQKISPVTVNIELRTLKAAFNVAVRWQILEKNPFKGLKLARLTDRAPVYFSKEEFQNLIERVEDEDLKDLIIFAVLTGMRRGEIVNLRWGDIDLARKLIQIQSSATYRTKQGKRRTIPLNEVVFALLQRRHGEIRSEYVFHFKGKKILEGTLTHNFGQCVKRAALKEKRIHFHSLRHTFASWLVQDGVSIYEVQQLLGHSNVAVTQVYSHLLPETRHQTVNRSTL